MAPVSSLVYIRQQNFMTLALTLKYGNGNRRNEGRKGSSLRSNNRSSSTRWFKEKKEPDSPRSLMFGQQEKGHLKTLGVLTWRILPCCVF
jgi:hypothetical protein